MISPEVYIIYKRLFWKPNL